MLRNLEVSKSGMLISGCGQKDCSPFVFFCNKRFVCRGIDVLSAVNDGDSLLRQQLALLITSVDSCC